MTFGYLIVVSKSKNADYLKLAYALALSIKNTQREGYNKVALIIDDDKNIKDLKSHWVFDEVINWNNEVYWTGRSWMDKLTPWDYTVCLDADMLFTRDYSHWIEYFVENCELYLPAKALTYRDTVITNDYYRKTFTANKLPNLYSFFTFFKKNSRLAKEFFTLARFIIKNPEEFKYVYCQKHVPLDIGTDEAFAIAANILDISNLISYDVDFAKVVHMKPMVQDWPYPAAKWTDHVGFYINTRGNIKIGNYYQYNIVHYVEKNLITDEVINILEEISWKK